MRQVGLDSMSHARDSVRGNVRAVSSQEDLQQLVRRVDDLGYDVLATPDHLGALAPFTALMAAAMTSPRLRTYVLNVGFWKPALLAREVATLDLLSVGRAEIGLGAGHMKSEHEDAQLPWLPLNQRVQLLQETVLQLRRRLADEAHQPRPVQHPVPVMIGAMSRSGLAVAARHAEVVGFAGLRQVSSSPPTEAAPPHSHAPTSQNVPQGDPCSGRWQGELTDIPAPSMADSLLVRHPHRCQ
jgi:probable F420-dependent oxidoreductase